MTTLLEVSGTGEGKGKGKTPKDRVCWKLVLGMRLRAV